MKSILLDCQYCYSETIIKYDVEECDQPRFCPVCGKEQDNDYEELEFQEYD